MIITKSLKRVNVQERKLALEEKGLLNQSSTTEELPDPRVELALAASDTLGYDVLST
jgi:hypothetical protein